MTAREWIRQQLLSEFDGVIRPRVGYFMENLAAKRNGPAIDPYSSTPVTGFASALNASKDATWNGFQMLGSWTRPFNDGHVINTLNGTPNDAMEAAFNTYRAGRVVLDAFADDHFAAHVHEVEHAADGVARAAAASSFSPRPSQGVALSAAFSVARRKSNSMTRSMS